MLRSIARTALLFACAATPALAHDVFPPFMALPPQGRDFIYVVDGGGCPAAITAKSTAPSLVKVAVKNMLTGAVGAFGAQVTVPDRIDQVFVVQAEPNIAVDSNASIEICWVGATAPNPPCSENNCSPYAPHVVSVLIRTDPLSWGSGPFVGVIGDPISTDDGEKTLIEPADLDLGGPMALYFERYYASRLEEDGLASSTLGPNWLSNFDWKMATVGTSVEIITSRGRLLRFENDGLSLIWSLAVYKEEPYALVESGPNRLLGDLETGVIRTFDSASGRLIAVSDGRGNTHALTYSGGLLSNVSDGIGRTLTFTHSSGRLTGVSDGTRDVALAYTAGVLTSVTDAAGATVSYTYAAPMPSDGGTTPPMTARTSPEGNTPYVHVFDTSGRALSETDALANATTLVYDSASGETTITDALGHAQVHDHAAGRRLTRWDDAAGSDAVLGYDSKNRRTSVRDRFDRTTSWTHDAASGRIGSFTEADGSTTSYDYIGRVLGGLTFHDLTAIDAPGAADESFAYDTLGRLTSAVDRGGNSWSFTYNARGQLLTGTDPLGALTALSYNADGTLASSTDPAGNTTSYAYDSLRRLETVTRPGASTLLFAYDALDRIVSHTDEDARTTSYAYDDNGRLSSVTDARSNVWTFGYDALDRLVSVLDPEGRTTSVTYDERGDTATQTNGAGETTSFSYDARRHFSSLSDALSNEWDVVEDAEGILKSIADPAGRTTSFGSDARGRITRVTTPLGHRTSYSYDAFGRVTRVTDPAGRRTDYDYDARGLLEGVTLPAAGAVTLARDARGGITALTYPGGSQWDFGYDAHGRLASVADPLGNTTTATYDVRNRVATLTFPGGLGSATFTWTDAGLLTNAALSDGTQLTYSYDANGRMIAAGSASFVWNDAGELVGSNGITTPRDAAGRIASVTLAPGKTVNYAYDARGLLESVTTWLGGVTTFTYDESGRLVGLARPNGLSTLYEYDDSSRLTRIRELRSALLGDEEHASIAITYVDTDQIRSVKLLPPSSLLPQLGQVQSTFNPAGQVSGNTYDAVGNLLVDGVKTNTFDLAGRLTTHSNGVDTIDIDYDALGFPVSLAGGPPAQFGRNYAAGGVTVVVRNGGGVDQLYVITTPAGGVLETIDAATDTSSYFHFDHTFSTRFLSDSGGNLTDHYAYDPRGVLLGHSGTSTQPFTFFGHYGVQAVPFTSLSFFGTRPFDSETGMFLTPRKRLIADARAANPYGDINLSQLLLDSGAPTSGRIPRFFGTGRDGGPLIADVTRTNLLYPFVSGGSGFDTGLAIHYPTSPAGSRDHSTGLGRDTLSSSRAPLLDVFSTSRLPGFQGYVMAQSGFQPAHGFAFIFDFGARRLAEGYLSLILDRRTTPVESTASLNEPVPNECAVIAKFRKRFPPGKPIPRHPTSQLGVSNASFWIGRGLNPFGDLNGAPVGRRPLSAPNLLGAEPSGLLPSSYSNPFLGLLTEERPSVRESIRRLLRSRP